MESLAFAQRADDLNAIASATANLGSNLLSLGSYADAQKYLEKGLSLARMQGNKFLIASTLSNLGYLAFFQGEFLKACELGRENLKICQECGSNFPLAVAFNYMGVFTQGVGDINVSRHYREESLLLSQQLSLPVMCLVVLGDLAELDELQGQYERSASLLGAVSYLRKKQEANFADRAETVAKLRTALGETAYKRAFEEGALLTLPEAIALATARRQSQ